MAAPRIVTRPIISAYEAAVLKSIVYPNFPRHFVFRVAFATSYNSPTFRKRWNETTISEYEPPTMGYEDDNENSEASEVTFIGSFEILSMLMLAVLFIHNEQDNC
jgi:hypothetical protein